MGMEDTHCVALCSLSRPLLDTSQGQIHTDHSIHIADLHVTLTKPTVCVSQHGYTVGETEAPSGSHSMEVAEFGLR